ncbi:MAG: hypothetical protein BWY19_01169 [bacterium ADurb.Bin212]|nr:MAG: hypothetical protein BWY19_01169 [bacterium ADurb.Bin212]
MKKTKTIEYTICDFCLKEGKEVEAVDRVQPSGLDVCAMHQKAFTEEIRLPDEFGKEMSGKKIVVDPGYNAQMVIEYKKENIKEEKNA